MRIECSAEQALDTVRSMILRHAAEFTCCGSLDAAKGREVFEERRQEVLSVLLEEIGFPQWWIDEADGLFALSQHKYMQVTANKKKDVSRFSLQ